jgi:beta-galactosidase
MLYKKISIPAFILFLFLTACSSLQAQVRHNFELGDRDFLLDGKPFQMISGEMHCARIPVPYWRQRMKMAKAMGLNTIGTYVFWNVHEPNAGTYDFSGNNNIAEFIRIAKEEGLWVVLRPSPYACAEWEFGGYPWWLLKDSTTRVRTMDAAFVASYTRYIKKLAAQIVPLLVTHGGNILMVQLENEYGSYSNDKSYLDLNRKIFREAGFDGLLFTCDGADMMTKGYLPGYLPAVNGLENPVEIKEVINKHHDGKGPYYVAEWYPGWFDQWGKPHAKVDAKRVSEKLDKILQNGISINMYMFHGGTTRGFMNGANMNYKEPYAPQIASYDYDAPLDEAGNPTEKFFAFRDVIKKYLPAGMQLPPVPAKAKTIAIDNIQLTSFASLFENLPAPVIAASPLGFEDLNQAYGFVLYRFTISSSKVGWLKIPGLRDFALVFVDGKRIGMLDRRLEQDSIWLENVPNNAVLDVLVENNGRINYGPFLVNNRKGIISPVYFNQKELSGWKMYRLPYEDLKTLKFGAPKNDQAPGFYKGSFIVTDPADTFLDLSLFGKGFVFLNGRNLGKYWQIGPQQTLYIPGCWLKKGKNELVVFDEVNQQHRSIRTLRTPVLNQLSTISN